MGDSSATEQRVNCKQVQATNDFSIRSKLSTVLAGYADDTCLAEIVVPSSGSGRKLRRSPLIHRGYYIRHRAMRTVLDWLYDLSEQLNHSPIQVYGDVWVLDVVYGASASIQCTRLIDTSAKTKITCPQPNSSASEMGKSCLLPSPRHSHAAACLSDGRSMMVVGGLTEDEVVLDDVWLLEPHISAWSRISVTGFEARYSHTLNVVGDNAIVVGGVSRVAGTNPGVAVIKLTTGVCRQFSQPSQGDWVRCDTMLHGHASVITCHADTSHQTGVICQSCYLLVVGGGTFCFSFGTHLNSSIWGVSLQSLLTYDRQREELYRVEDGSNLST